MPGPGSGINSLMDLMQPQQQGGGNPPSFGSWDDRNMFQQGPPLYSGSTGPGGTGGAGAGAVFTPPPELARYFDQFGNYRIDDPRQVAAESGITPSQLAGGFFPRYDTGKHAVGTGGQGYEYPSDLGGFFSAEDLFRGGGATVQPAAAGAMRAGGPGANPTQRVMPGSVPQIGTLGAGAPSTNNWRLLGRGPGWIMRNGFLINTGAGGTRWGGPSGWTPTGGNTGEQSMPAAATSLGAGQAYGVPNMLQSGLGQAVTYGWPGATQWFHDPGATPDAGLGG